VGNLKARQSPSTGWPTHEPSKIKRARVFHLRVFLATVFPKMRIFTRPLKQSTREEDPREPSREEQLAELDTQIAYAKKELTEAQFEESRWRGTHHGNEKIINFRWLSRVSSMQLDMANAEIQTRIRRTQEAHRVLNDLLRRRADLRCPGWRTQ
jgi:hypothetical protein